MDEFEWTILNESKLFEAMVGHKPVGINKYFEMACIWEKLQENDVDIASEKIWSHLETMYNYESISEIESIPFPNEEREFYLPELEFGAMKVKKEEKAEDKSMKSIPKRNDIKEIAKIFPPKEIKKEEKVIGKKDTPRRDSKDGKDVKTILPVKKEIKKEPVDKMKPFKGRSSTSVKEESEKTPTRTPSRAEELIKRQNKRPTRGSMKPDDISTPIARKSQSPLTITTPISVNKRRRI